ncbi:MAG: S8 family serine peptidase [Chloroflexota bacterium]
MSDTQRPAAGVAGGAGPAGVVGGTGPAGVVGGTGRAGTEGGRTEAERTGAGPSGPEHAEAGRARAGLTGAGPAATTSTTTTTIPAPLPAHLTDGLITHAGPDGTEVAVSITLATDADLAPVAAILGRLGANHVQLDPAGALIEASLPIVALDALAASPGVRRVDPIRRPLPQALTSAGVSIHGADAWQQAGYTGTGIRIGIIDGGFTGISDRLATEFPGGIQARCYSDIGTFSSSLAACEADGETHGTAVAETIADMAPDATLYLANPISMLDTRQAIAWMTGAGVRVINASFGASAVFEGPGDGTSPNPDTYYTAVDTAVAGGALWVNSAGNSADLGWSGPWTDANDNGWLEFSGSDEANSFTLAAGQAVDVAIRWPDRWGAATTDYDLYLFPAGATLPVASSTDPQSGTGDPVEHLRFTAATSGSYDVQIAWISGNPVGPIQLLIEGQGDGLTYQVPAGTLPSPADSANPGLVTIGAVNVASPDTIEPYSSRGPTVDGRTKPDLVAVDCAATTTLPRFCGTSQSAPYVSGAAALLLQADPTLGPAQLAAALRAHTAALGTPIPNSTFGWGRLALGPAPGTPPPPPPPPPPPGPPPPGLKALSGPGTAVTWRGLATSGTTGVHVVFGESADAGNTVVYRRSSDGGATFEAAVQLSPRGVEAGYAAVASAGPAVHVAWLEGDLVGTGPVAVGYRASTDGGLTWSAPRLVSSAGGRAGNPALAVDSAGHVLVAWTDAVSGRIWGAASADGGATFASPRAIGRTTLRPFRNLADLDGLPSVAFGSGGRGYVAWADGPTRILVRRTADAGGSWLPVQIVDSAASGNARTWLSAYGSGVAVAYAARPADGRPALAYVRRSGDGGATWQTRRLVSATTTLAAFEPAVTIKGAVVRVAWAQCTTSTCTRARVWYRQSADGGASWSSALALTGTSTYAYPTGLAATSRILVLYDAASSSTAATGTAYLRIR